MSTIYYPLDSYKSTYLNSRCSSMEILAERIVMSLGGGVVDVEVGCDLIMDCIGQAVELYIKHVGYSREFLLFRSDLYQNGWGIDLGRLFSISSEMQDDPNFPNLSAGYDYDIDVPRKVLGVFEFNEGITSGIGNLFTIESTMMNMIMFSPGIGNMGFDILSWHIAKEYLEMREKVFATKVQFRFNKDTQLMRLFPEPRPEITPYYGLIGCYVEKAFKDCLKERWVFEYAQALVMRTIGFIRGKYQNTTLFGSGTINYNDMLSLGNSKEEKLREQIKSANHEDWKGVMFFVG
jgi:hypothetical protein